MARKKCVAFVSERNSCRSIIAEAYLRRRGIRYFETLSFGLRPNRIHYLVYSTLQEKGFNLNFYFSKAYEVVERQKFDILVLMHPEIKKRLPGIQDDCKIVVWNFEDPTDGELDEPAVKREIEKLCDRIESQIETFIEPYKETAEESSS